MCAINRIKLLREEKGMYQRDLAKIINVSAAALGFYETERRSISAATASALASFFGVSVDYLLGKSNYRNEQDFFEKNQKTNRKFIDIAERKNETVDSETVKEILKAIKDYKDNFKDNVKIPILGKISAGLPLYAEENLLGYDYVPTDSINPNEEYFYLVVKGDSMNRKFNEGDRVLIHKQDTLENDEIGVILINGDDATIKKYRYDKGMVILEPMSFNPEHHAQIYNPKDTNIRIIGKAIKFIRDI